MKRLYAGTPVVVGETTIFPLEQLATCHCSMKKGFFIYASREPFGLVISSSQGRWAVSLDGEDMPLETLIQEIDGLGQVLDGM